MQIFVILASRKWIYNVEISFSIGFRFSLVMDGLKNGLFDKLLYFKVIPYKGLIYITSACVLQSEALRV